MWYVYIIRCKDGSLYTGSTTDVDRRILEHNSGKCCKYTRIRRPVTLLHTERCSDKSKAQRREAQIKDLTRKEKIALIEAESQLS